MPTYIICVSGSEFRARGLSGHLELSGPETQNLSTFPPPHPGHGYHQAEEGAPKREFDEKIVQLVHARQRLCSASVDVYTRCRGECERREGIETKQEGEETKVLRSRQLQAA
jgi:hypothetical protein